MDAEIRILRYIPRFGGGTQTNSAISGGAPLVGNLPQSLRKGEAPGSTTSANEFRLQARIIELERERTESERRGRETLAVSHEQAAHALANALREQQERLEQSWAARIEAALLSFEKSRSQYFVSMETEVVRLALAIAARVLHREAQLDPLFLRGPVRVALEDIQQNAACVLEVAAETAEVWEGWLANRNTDAVKVQLRVKQDAAANHCRMEIDASTADLSTSAQLAEIERGFFDLLQHRPLVTHEVRE